MAIEFKCTTCGKNLFAREQFAGMRTTCPGCQTKTTIPQTVAAVSESVPATSSPSSSSAPSSDSPIAEEVYLIDMEKVVPDTAATAAPSAVPNALNEATKRCPMCAETIKAAAKKCRFCGEILDADLKRESVGDSRRTKPTTDVARSLDAVLRGASILATMLTTGYMLVETLNSIVLRHGPTSLDFLAPWPLYVFNVMMIGGFLSLIRQMKTGPAHVFLTAALAIVVCMPLDMFLGLPLPGLDQFVVEAKKQDLYKDWTQSGFVGMFAFLTGLIGAIISVPVWLTGLMLALRSRLKN